MVRHHEGRGLDGGVSGGEGRLGTGELGGQGGYSAGMSSADIRRDRMRIGRGNWRRRRGGKCSGASWYFTLIQR